MGTCATKTELAIENLNPQQIAATLLKYYNTYDTLNPTSQSKYDTLIKQVLTTLSGNMPLSSPSS